MSQWIVVSNRLPFEYSSEQGLTPTSGGLVTAIKSIKTDHKILWVGSATPALADDRQAMEFLRTDDPLKEMHPVFVDDSDFDLFYNGFCNDTLWPLFHYAPDNVDFRAETWTAYRKINEQFAREIASISHSEDIIWIHDFHFLLLPQMLKQLRPELRVGLFLHIPFPTSEIFRQIPVRRQLLEGMLGADLIGFHDYAYLSHFCSSALGILGAESDLLTMKHQGRTVRLGVYPISIDTAKLIQDSKSPEVSERITQIPKEEFLFLGVDRLDYIKGVDLKLKAFAKLLENYPEVRGKVGLLQIAIPTRENVEQYQKLRNEVARLVGDINGRFGQADWTPVRYVFSSISYTELMALYRGANALVVTSKRDGMNLVSMEYIACQDEANPGLVLLSEFAGSHAVLSAAMSINPWDSEGTAALFRAALDIPIDERKQRFEQMRDYLLSYDTTAWAYSFIEDLLRIRGPRMRSELLSPTPVGASRIQQRLPRSDEKVFLFLDFDGTMSAITDHPDRARIEDSHRPVLNQITHHEKFDVVILSGRSRSYLQREFADGCWLAAEHGGTFYNPKTGQWTDRVFSDKSVWYPQTLKIMKDYARRVPRSFVEQKDFSLAWHYRASPRDYANYQANKLLEELDFGLSNLPVSILKGKKVIEVRAIEANKGQFVNWFLDSHAESSSAIAIGDDVTDEEMFNATKGRGLSVKVGPEPTAAEFRLSDQTDVWPLLESLLKIF